MKVWITRDWTDKTYEIWETKPCGWGEYNDYGGDHKSKIVRTGIPTREAKEMFKLDKHLKKKEIIEATMTFKIKK